MWKHLLLVAAIAFVVRYIITNLDAYGYFEHTFNHAPGKCRKLHEIEFGSEDIQSLPNGLAFISSGLRWRNTDEYNRRPGRIYLFDFNQPQLAPQELIIKADKDYKLVSPHGINIWTDPKSGEVYLYVISHVPDEIVDKFKFEPTSKSLTHLKRLAADTNFHSLNDLAVVGDDQFYFTNYLYISDRLEFPLGLRWGSLGFFDGTRTRLIVTGLFGPNGIALSPDGRFLYVAALVDREIRVYQRHLNNNSLTFIHSISVFTTPDNLNVDMATGDLWFGSHPVGYKAMQHLDDPRLPSPSQVIKMRMSDENVTSVEEIYSNDGSEFSGSTVAVIHKKQLLIGSVVQSLLYCEIV
jgi:hypothetical protein